MTIAAEPEIVLDGLGAEPPTTSSASHDPPPAPSAPSQSHLPVAESASPAMATATATPVGTTRATVVRTTLPDGSLEIRVTSTATDVPEGHRRVKTEWYRVPASLAGMTAGEVPGALYLTRVEEEVVPLGGGEGGVPSASGGDSHPQSQEQAQYQQAQPPIDDYFQNQNNRPSWHEARHRNRLLGVFSVLFFGAILLPMIAVFASRRHDGDDATTSTWNDDDWRSSFFDDDDWYHHRHWYDDFQQPTVSPSPTRPPVPTASPRPSSKDTRPPWLRPYTLPPQWLAPTSSPASPRPSADFGGFTLPPFLGPWTPVVRGGPVVENVVVEGSEEEDLRVDVDVDVDVDAKDS